MLPIDSGPVSVRMRGIVAAVRRRIFLKKTLAIAALFVARSNCGGLAARKDLGMSRTIRPTINGVEVPVTAPVIPVKSEAQLLMEAELDRLKRENESLRQRPTGGSLSLKVSEKGALSVYGMGRFPVTLYREQWERLFAAAKDIKAFIDGNSHRLKLKGQE